MEKWARLAEKRGFIVAGLDALDPKTWRAPADGPAVLQTLVNSLTEEFPIDRQRVYLFGHSGGAVFTLVMSLMESEYFAAAAIHAGALGPTQYDIVELASRNIPIKILVGDGDRFFPVASVESTATVLREHGIPVEVEIIRGHDHWYYDRAGTFNKSVWEFLSNTELTEGPFYTQQFP